MKMRYLLFLIVPVLLFTASCISFKKNYMYKPSIWDIAKEGDNKQITDAAILDFSNTVKDGLRTRMHYSKIIRLASSSIETISMILVASQGIGGGADVNTLARFAGLSAAIPQIQSIFKAKARAVAYDGGVRLIERAESRYLIKLAEKGDSSISEKLTSNGALLYKEIIASLDLVGKALMAQIPDIQNVKEANGEYEDMLAESKVVVGKTE